jgi:two-component system, cell cycle response regulator
VARSFSNRHSKARTMPGRILIVDNIPTNRILLRVRLAATFYDVMQAGTGAEALDMVAQHAPDLVLISARLVDCDSLDLCRAITGMTPPPQTSQRPPDPFAAAGQIRPPVLILTAQTDRQLRLAALAAGAEDVLAFPLDDLLLQARLRSLMRVGDAVQETHLRDGTSRTLGFAEAAPGLLHPPRICILSDNAADPLPWRTDLRKIVSVRITRHDSRHFLREVTAGDTPDLCLIVMENPLVAPGLRLLSELRAHPETRQAATLVILPEADNHIAADTLDLGAGDVLSGAFEEAELGIRITTLIRRKRMADQLRSTLRDGLRAAVTDPLTGLYNRRYALPHLARMADHAAQNGRRFAVMLADLDHFKSINDRFGHAAGDAVLVEVARRLRANLRAVDLIARIGGEEFLLALPDTDRAEARVAARRLCRIIAQDPFDLPGHATPVAVTVSIGVAMGQRLPQLQQAVDDPLHDTVQRLINQADRALYGAKACGRNQVTISTSAA